MQRRRFKTEADIERYISQGYGQGEGSSYQPWIGVKDVSSNGRSRKVAGTKSSRIHHTLSDLEYFYLLSLEFADEVVDIREQYPLFATHSSRDIAAELGIRYPMYLGTQLHYVLTSDFVLTIVQPDGKKHLAVRTCKYESELTDPSRSGRVLEKLELERAIWRSQGVSDWKVVTEKLLSPVLKQNLDWLYKSAWYVEEQLTMDDQLRFAKAAVAAATGDRKLSAVIRSVCSTLGIPNRHGMALFKSLVWRKAIVFDISQQRLDAEVPCPVLTVRANSFRTGVHEVAAC